jgi:hypothetical protein
MQPGADPPSPAVLERGFSVVAARDGTGWRESVLTGRPPPGTARGPGPWDPGLWCCGRYWVRTSDLYRVKVALYH